MATYVSGWHWTDNESATETEPGISHGERMDEVDGSLSDLENSDDHGRWTLMVPLYLESMVECPWFPAMRPEDHML